MADWWLVGCEFKCHKSFYDLKIFIVLLLEWDEFANSK